jgi:tRNA-modifying protein YgfZ
MNSIWEAFLRSRDAQIDGEDRARFPQAPLAANCAIMDLSELGIIAVSGAEAADFLQGQLTNDVRALGPARSQLSAYCSPKGRMLASFRVFRMDDTIYLQLAGSRLGPTLQRLRMFLLRAKVTLEDASDQLVRIGIAGDCAPGLLAHHLPGLSTEDNAVTRTSNLLAIRVPGTPPRFEIVAPAEAAAVLWNSLAANVRAVNADFWSLLDIRAGLPNVYEETADAFVPQMANMHLIDGVSFTKGCYTGQEVVARMQYLGSLKRRMYLGEVATDVRPERGAELHSTTSISEQATGRVVDIAESGPGRFELLAVVEIGAAETAEVRLGPDGPRVVLKAPPYGFSAET